MNALDETITCMSCKAEFPVYPDDVAMYEKFGTPVPKQCPNCRLAHLFSFWIFGRFRKTKSALSGKSIITVIPETVPYPLYEREEWFSDGWDPLEYGLDYDPNRSFFEQIYELQETVPRPHQAGTKNVRCEWSDDVWSSKNCYLCRSLLNCEDISYCYRTIDCKNSLDLAYCFDVEHSYDSLFCFKCFKTNYSFNCKDCIESSFLYDCRNCQNCFMSWNLRNKEYHILNKPYSKEEYLKEMERYDLHSWSGVEKLKEQFQKAIAKEAVHRENLNFQTVDSEGNILTECRNCFYCVCLEESENCRYFWRGVRAKDCIDCVSVLGEQNTNSVMCISNYGLVGCSHASNCRYSYYLISCEDCEYCFGCVGMRKKKYCILNKQYSKEEYDALTEKIREDMKKNGEWGAFFPSSFVGFGYNLSNAQFYFPSTPEAVQKTGGTWHAFPDETSEGISADALPERIEEVEDSIISQPLVCPQTKWRYNIAPHELAFYRANNIPLPRRHFDLRITRRFGPLVEMVHPVKGVCCFCKKEITHYFPEDWRYRNIACVECYQQNVS